MYTKLHALAHPVIAKTGLAANINATTTKNTATEGEIHWTTDTNKLYVYDGTQNQAVSGIVFLGSATVGMQTADGAQTFFTTPTGVITYISHVIVRDPTASLAGGTDFDFTQWKQTVDLSSMTTSGTDYMFLDGNNTKYQEIAAATAFQITPNTGSTADADATIDVFGYLV